MVTSVHSRALAKAADLIGGRDELAKRLRVPRGELQKWLAGEEETPQWAFLRAVDIILDETSAPGGSEEGEPPAPREASSGDHSASRY